MKRFVRWACWIGCGCLSLAALAADPAAPAKPKIPVAVGTQAPDFSLRDHEGNLIRLNDFVFPGAETAHHKKIELLLDFFATDCKACKAELPQVVAYSKKHAGDVQVVLVAIPEKEDGVNKLEKFLTDNPVPFPVLVDSYETVAKKYVADGSTMTLPATFFIGKSGKIRVIFLGLEKDLEASLQSALAGNPPAP